MVCNPNCCDTLSFIGLMSSIFIGMVILLVIIFSIIRFFEMSNFISEIQERWFYSTGGLQVSHLQQSLEIPRQVIVDLELKYLKDEVNQLKEELKKGKKNVK